MARAVSFEQGAASAAFAKTGLLRDQASRGETFNERSERLRSTCLISEKVGILGHAGCLGQSFCLPTYISDRGTVCLFFEVVEILKPGPCLGQSFCLPTYTISDRSTCTVFLFFETVEITKPGPCLG